MQPVEWEVDERTRVRVVHGDDGTEIQLWQGDDNLIVLSGSGASPGGMAEAILAAIVSVANVIDFDMPDLTPYGYTADTPDGTD